VRRSLAIVAVIALSSVSAATADTVIGEKANGKTVAVSRDALVDIRVSSPRGTGYSWELASFDGSKVRVYDIDILEPAQKPGQPPIAGGSGTYVVKLRVRAPGRSTVRLELVRFDGRVGRRFAVSLVAK
jgi:predicted secreted protein